MKGETHECWMELCALAAEERDPEKLLALAVEISRLLEEKENRLKQKRVALGLSSAALPAKN